MVTSMTLCKNIREQRSETILINGNKYVGLVKNNKRQSDIIWLSLTGEPRPPKLLNECICQPAVRTDLMRDLILSAFYWDVIGQLVSYWALIGQDGSHERLILSARHIQ